MSIKKYYPVKTSKYISIYEYARILTDLSLYLYNQKSLSKYIDDIEINNVIDTNKIAYKLLKSGTFDATIDRGYEKVTFSVLKINPLYDRLIETFLNEQENNVNETFLSLIKLI